MQQKREEGRKYNIKPQVKPAAGGFYRGVGKIMSIRMKVMHTKGSTRI